MFPWTERLAFMKQSTLLIESTRGCGQTPHLLVLLDELEAPFELIFRPDGYFLASYGLPGPRLVDGHLTLFQVPAMLRHCARTRAEGRLLPRSPCELARVDAWLELATQLALTALALSASFLDLACDEALHAQRASRATQTEPRKSVLPISAPPAK